MKNANRFILPLLLLAGAALQARADAITDWNLRSSEIIAEAKMGTPPAIRVMALAQTAAYEAANAITGKYPASRLPLASLPSASLDAAVAAAHRATLVRLLPAQQASIDKAYEAALGKVADSPAKSMGIALGEQAALAVLAARADDMPKAPEAYRPHTSAGVYVPTAPVAVPVWSQRKPWLMASAAQFRPGPPPALTSAEWANDYNEVKALGGKSSARRTPEQADIARFWEYSLPAIYFGVVHSVANQPGREPTQNARLFAAVAQAMDDAMIAVFEAKYHYNFWRPATAIRNGDIDGNEATEREPSWAPFVDNPIHPEYPSGHGILAGAVSAVLKAELGAAPAPVLATASPTLKGATRQWQSADAFAREIGDSRIYGGLHYRFSMQAAEAMGRKIGELAAKGNANLAAK